MPIINNNAVPMPKPEDGRSARRFVTKAVGAANVTIGELVMQHGAALRLHTHPTDEAIILLEGQVEMVVGDERRVVSAGHTLLAPPGTPHRLINNTGAPARMYTVFPTDNPQTEYVD
jgi:quercetin dioxygenase-like cupin family protein